MSYAAAENRLSWQRRTQGFADGDRFAIKTRIGFVDSLAEVLSPLLRGITIVALPQKSMRDPKLLLETLVKSRTTRITLVPSQIQGLLSAHGVETGSLIGQLSLRTVVSSGEELSLSTCEAFFNRIKNCELHNYYGSTETMGDVSALFLRSFGEAEANSQHGRISLGTPIDNMTIALCDVDESGIGELVCSGDSLASNCLNPSESGLQRFRKMPYQVLDQLNLTPHRLETIWFHTGDMAKLQDGKLFFMGRRDDVVKISGNKVNLNHVSNMIANEASFVHSVIVVESRLMGKPIAFYHAQESVDIREISTRLNTKLPDYSVPLFCSVRQFPVRSGSDKIDKAGLLEWYERLQSQPVDLVYDWNAMSGVPDETLAKLKTFTQILNENGIRSHSVPALLNSNFQAAGGSSLTSIAIASKLAGQALGTNTKDYLNTATVGEMFEVFSAGAARSTESSSWTASPLRNEEWKVAVDLIATNFVDIPPFVWSWTDQQKSTYSRDTCYAEIVEFCELMKPQFMTPSSLSFAIYAEGTMIGVVLGVLPGPAEVPSEHPRGGLFRRIMKYLADVEEPVFQMVKERDPPAIVAENTLTGIDTRKLISVSDRVKCMYMMEEHALAMATDHSAVCIVTSNVASITQDIGPKLGYEIWDRVKCPTDLVTDKDEKCLEDVPEDFRIDVSYKWLN